MLTRHKGSFFMTNTETGSSNNLASDATACAAASAPPAPAPPPPPLSPAASVVDGSPSSVAQSRFRTPEQPLGVWWLQKKGVRSWDAFRTRLFVLHPTRLEYYSGPIAKAKEAMPNPPPPSSKEILSGAFTMKGMIMLADMKRIAVSETHANKGLLDVQEAKARSKEAKGKRKVGRFPIMLHMKKGIHVSSGRHYLLKAFSETERDDFHAAVKAAHVRLLDLHNEDRCSSAASLSSMAGTLDSSLADFGEDVDLDALEAERCAMFEIYRALGGEIGSVGDDEAGAVEAAAGSGPDEGDRRCSTAGGWVDTEGWDRLSAIASATQFAGILVPCVGVRTRPDHSVIGVRLPNNGLVGRLPIALTGLTRLEFLALPNNDISGHIPAAISELVHLKELNLSGNLLTGEIPDTITSLSDLRTLALSSNQLTGLVPEGLGESSQSHLSSVRLQDNDLCGYAPPGVLKIIGMGSQVLLPPGLCLPDEMGDLGDELEYLDLSGMGLDGWLPPSIGTLVHLEELYLHDNKCCGPIPDEIGQLVQLRNLNFSSCEFSGPLPESLLQLTQLTCLDVSFNQLEGEIFDGLFKIETLRLAGNSLMYQGELWVEEPDADELRDTMDAFKPSIAYDPEDTTRMSYSEDMFLKFFSGGLGVPGGMSALNESLGSGECEASEQGAATAAGGSSSGGGDGPTSGQAAEGGEVHESASQGLRESEALRVFEAEVRSQEQADACPE